MARTVLWWVLAVAGLWAGAWTWGARGLDARTEAWLEARRSDGWVAEWSDISVRGFPNRYDMTIAAPELADPDGGLAWSGAFLQVMRLVYKPRHAILVWPPVQQVATPTGKLRLETEEMRASVVLGKGEDWPLDRMTLVARGGALDRWRFDEVRLASRPGATAEVQEIALEALGVARSGAGRLDRLRLAGTVTFDSAWTRDALEHDRPQPTEIALDDAALQWGRLELRAAGTLSLDRLGRASGRVTLRASDWEEVYGAARASGAVPDALAPLLHGTLRMLAEQTRPTSALDTEIVVRDGDMRLGPLPLGTLPRLRLP